MDKRWTVPSLVFVRTLRIVLISMVLAKSGRSQELEEPTHIYSACYSSSQESVLNVSCPGNAYIFPYYVGTGVKTNNCSNILDSGQVMSEADEARCCKTPNATGDCVHRYTNQETPYLVENLCVGRHQCAETLVPHDSIANMNCSSSFNMSHLDSTYMMLRYYCIEGQRIRTPFSPLVNNEKMIYLILTYMYGPEFYTQGIVPIKARCTVEASQIEVWLIDLRLKNESKQSIVFSNETANVSIDASCNTAFHPRMLSEIGGSSALNITFDTTKSEQEFLWFGFKATSGRISFQCLDLRPRTVIQTDVPPLPDDQKLTGLQIGAITGGAGFLAVSGLVLSMIYRRWKRSKVMATREEVLIGRPPTRIEQMHRAIMRNHRN